MLAAVIVGSSPKSRIKKHVTTSSTVKKTKVFKSSSRSDKVKSKVKEKEKDAVEQKYGILSTQIDKKLLEMSKEKPPLDPKLKELFYLVREGNHEKVKKLIKDKDLDVNARDTEDDLLPTPLLVAAELNDTEMVRLLLKAKSTPARINDEDIKGKRAIWYAAKNGNKELAEILTMNSKQECEVNVLDKQTGCTPLYRAILSNCAGVVQVLIHTGADVNLRRLGYDVGAETPLIKAVQLDNKAICELLINSMCKLQAKTENGLTALHYAIAYHRYDICKLLLENQIKIHSRTNSGVTAMTIAIEHHNAAMVKILLEFGYKMDKRYKWKETPLEQAIKLHAQDCALTLLHFGCSLVKEKGKSYFNLAVEEKLLKVIKFMINLQPTFLNEEFIQKRNWPVSLYYRPDIMDWISKEAEQPRTLKQLCRARIYRQLGKYSILKVSKLQLPEPLKEYMKFHEHIKEKYYIEKPLTIEECPFDCPAICSMRYCPPIEISDSEPEPDSDDCLTD